MKDQQLWESISGGDETSYQELFYQYYSGAVTLAFKYLGDKEAAKDIAQELFYKLWVKRTQISIQKSIGVYINQSVRNACLNYLKRQKKLHYLDEQLEITDETPGALELLQSNDILGEVNRAIALLPPACRTVFLMRRIEGLSLKEIADHLDISTKTVENQITKAAKLLAKLLVDHLALWLLIGFIFWLAVGVLPNISVFK
jgi:RNA polymerase sigma-70 factor (ECF subfamily)